VIPADRLSTMTLVELLAELGQVSLLVHRNEVTLAVAVFDLQGRQLLVIERTYREGICVILDPTPEEIETARSGYLWNLWNSDRAKDLAGVI